ncbi:hypothetical protein D9M69_573160 [compost metagenome]
MAGEGRLFQIIHARALQRSVGDVEARRLDQVHREAEACGHAQDGSRVSGNVRLVKSDTQFHMRRVTHKSDSRKCSDRLRLSRQHINSRMMPGMRMKVLLSQKYSLFVPILPWQFLRRHIKGSPCSDGLKNDSKPTPKNPRASLRAGWWPSAFIIPVAHGHGLSAWQFSQR